MKTILIVDDEFDLANTLRSILEGDGHHPEVCSDGREALARLQDAKQRRPDLVLMDIMMPRLSGLEVLRGLRAMPGMENVPVVLMSIVTPKVSRSEYGWDAFLHKPFTIQALMKTVHQFVPPAPSMKKELHTRPRPA